MRYLLLLLTLTVSAQLYANNYYFSSSTGDDSRSAAEAQNPSTPWRTIEKLNSIMGSLNPGDFVFFNRNDVFAGSIVVTKSGTGGMPITFGAYGSGAKPVITGLSSFGNWTSMGNGTWESSSSASSRINVVLVNYTARPIGRWPNRDAANSGYLYYESYSGNTQITDNDLPGSPNWTGGEVVIRKVRWVIDRNVITQHSGNTIHYNSESHYGASYKHGYFIQNHPATLDIPGEWYYKLNEKKLGIYFPSGDPSASVVEASTVDSLISVIGQSNIAFDDIALLGANINAFNLINTQNIRITNCTINHSGLNAINGLNANNLTVENSTIENTNNTALNLVDCSFLTARNNKIKNTGMVAGMGKGDAGAYEAILVNGDNETIEQNEIENTGYIPITFRGNVNIIRNNYINNFAMVKDDASGIYTWNNIPNTPPTYGSKISGNLILNGIGAGDGTEHPDYFPANGIYMDDNTVGVEITGNTVANCSLFGMYIHNARNITIVNNTLFNNLSQIVYRSDQHSTSPIRGIAMLNNVLFSKGNRQLTAEYSTDQNDLPEFGTIDSNYHVRPLDPNNLIYVSYHENGNFNSNAVPLERWQEMFGKERHSKGSPVLISDPELMRFEYNPTFSSKTIPLDGTYIDARNNSYNGSITLGPLSGAGLIKTAGGVPELPSSGLNYRYYEGDWDWFPNFNALAPVKTGTTANVSLDVRNSNDHFGLVWEGMIHIPTPGDYTFETISDDGSNVYFNSLYSPDATPLVDNSGLHSVRSATGTVYVPAAGYYPIAITYFEKGGDEVMQLLWSGPGIPRQPVPNQAFSRNMVASVNSSSNPNSLQLSPNQGLNGKKFEFSATPNPFKSVATIRFTPEESGTASLDVIDLQGRLVQRVFNGNLQSGVPRVFQLHGDKLKTGVYIVRMATATKVVTRKIVVGK